MTDLMNEGRNVHNLIYVKLQSLYTIPPYQQTLPFQSFLSWIYSFTTHYYRGFIVQLLFPLIITSVTHIILSDAASHEWCQDAGKGPQCVGQSQQCAGKVWCNVLMRAEEATVGTTIETNRGTEDKHGQCGVAVDETHQHQSHHRSIQRWRRKYKFDHGCQLITRKYHGLYNVTLKHFFSLPHSNQCKTYQKTLRACG